MGPARQVLLAELRRRRRPLARLLAWSVPEAAPAAVSGLAVARALDAGFLVGDIRTGLAWLGVLLVAGGIGGIGARQVYRVLADLVEPFRDELVRRVVDGGLRRATAAGGRRDTAAVARVTHQVEVVRDTYAGMLVVVRGFLVTTVAAVVGLLGLAPVLLLFVLPPLVAGIALFAAATPVAARRYRDYVLAEEVLAARAGLVAGGRRDVAGCGAERYAARWVGEAVAAQAAAERAVARVAAVRTASLAVSVWLPLVALVTATPWLADRGLGPGVVLGALTYLLQALRPAVATLMHGVGGGGLRLTVTLDRLLTADVEDAAPRPRAVAPVGSARGCELELRGVTFAYGPYAEPVLRDVDLLVPEGDHLAVLGASGVGKSTLANLLAGILPPDRGQVTVGGVPVAALDPVEAARLRVLVPQEAYVVRGTVWANLTYLRPAAGPEQVRAAVRAVGADALVSRLGGWSAEIVPAALSAGEQQLLTLARAYLSPAPVALLDEATCHLDPVAEDRAERAFADRPGTLVVVAHRVSSALRARRVLVVDGASLVVGSHEVLLERSPLYRDLVAHWHSDAAPVAATVAAQIQPAS
jgi:ATP-binding cassette subfamily C protein